MAITPYLAMTAGEIAVGGALPKNLAWMACHFSPYSRGLSNRPKALPEGSLLILNDRIPIHGHDPGQVLQELEDSCRELGCCRVLLDFQRPDCRETAALTEVLVRELQAPPVVSSQYAPEGAPVLIPPLPLGKALGSWLEPWQGRELWLELAGDSEVLTLTAEGCSRGKAPEAGPGTFVDPRLHLHYAIRADADQAFFSLRRTREDLAALLKEAEALGVAQAVGLYQELEALV